MQNYDYRSIVPKAEADALKEMIFNRVRQRAEALNKETQDKYTTSFKEELMDIARNSFTSPGNPFTQKLERKQADVAEQVNKKPEVGFKQREISENIKEVIKQKNEVVNEVLSHSEVSSVMDYAGADFRTTQQFMGALEFLNAQAGIYMANKNKASFEVLA